MLEEYNNQKRVGREGKLKHHITCYTVLMYSRNSTFIDLVQNKETTGYIFYGQIIFFRTIACSNVSASLFFLNFVYVFEFYNSI